MNQHQTKAFTLVELIVVITILAILGTIAFISLQGYSKSARDSSRVSDVNTIESSLELFALQSGYYPEPSDNIDVTFSGGQVWTQGTLGNSVSGLVQRLNKTPVDPLTGTEYTYSRLNTKGEIEIAAVLEDGDLSQVSNTYAGNLEGSAYVTGNYNGAIAKVSTGSNLYVLAVPTLISGDISVTDYTSLIDQGELVFNGGEVLPASYDGSTFKTDTTSITGMSTGSIVVYNSGSSLPSNDADLDVFITNLQTAYSGSSIADSGNIAAIVNETNSNTLNILAESLVEVQLGGSVATTTQSIQSSPTNPTQNCKSILDNGDSTGDGIYSIDPNGTAFDIYCDMTTDGGGWTLISKYKGSLNWTKIYSHTGAFSTGSLTNTTADINAMLSYEDIFGIINDDPDATFRVKSSSYDTIIQRQDGDNIFETTHQTGVQFGCKQVGAPTWYTYSRVINHCTPGISFGVSTWRDCNDYIGKGTDPAGDVCGDGSSFGNAGGDVIPRQWIDAGFDANPSVPGIWYVR